MVYRGKVAAFLLFLLFRFLSENLLTLEVIKLSKGGFEGFYKLRPVPCNLPLAAAQLRFFPRSFLVGFKFFIFKPKHKPNINQLRTSQGSQSTPGHQCTSNGARQGARSATAREQGR